MRKLDLVNSIEDRNEVMTIENETKVLEILKRLGDVVDYMTEPMVAEFYGVTTYTLNKIGTRNKEELGKYGYRSYKKSEIEKMHNIIGLENINIPNRGLRLYPPLAVFAIGMMLTESKVAEQLRNEFLGVNKFKITRKEIEFINQLEQVLKPFDIKGKRQYEILSYRIDYYIPSLNIAIEYDENNHSNYTYEAHEGRQEKIEKELNCKFIRVSDKNSNEYNIGYVIKNIFNL